MTNREKIIIIGGVLLLAAVIILFTFIGKRKDEINHKALIKATDETIKAERQLRDTERKFNDYLISELQTKDSLLQIKDKTNTVKYEKIPVYINSLDREGLRAAGERAAEQ